jgi:hypothetical protein
MAFHEYIKEMNGSRSKIPSKNLVRQRYAAGFNSGVKGFIFWYQSKIAQEIRENFIAKSTVA